MSAVIVDTNVAVVANRQNKDVTRDCADACVRFLIEAMSSRAVLLDAGNEIRKEYAKALSLGKPYQLGAQFLIQLLRHQGNSQRVNIVELVKTPQGDFVDFPPSEELAAFDRSDRKFAALAKKMDTPVTNATDGDWLEFEQALFASGILVEFLCGRDKSGWFRE